MVGSVKGTGASRIGLSVFAVTRQREESMSPLLSTTCSKRIFLNGMPSACSIARACPRTASSVVAPLSHQSMCSSPVSVIRLGIFLTLGIPICFASSGQRRSSSSISITRALRRSSHQNSPSTIEHTMMTTNVQAPGSRPKRIVTMKAEKASTTLQTKASIALSLPFLRPQRACASTSRPPETTRVVRIAWEALRA